MTASLGKIRSSKTLKQIEMDADAQVENMLLKQEASVSGKASGLEKVNDQGKLVIQDSVSFRSSSRRRIFSEKSPQLKAN